jgi:hypothetical protein
MKRSFGYLPVAKRRQHVGHQFLNLGFAIGTQLGIRFEQSLPRGHGALAVALALQTNHPKIEQRIGVSGIAPQCFA